MRKHNKYLLTLAAITATAAPVVAVVSCGSKSSSKTATVKGEIIVADSKTSQGGLEVVVPVDDTKADLSDSTLKQIAEKLAAKVTSASAKNSFAAFMGPQEVSVTVIMQAGATQAQFESFKTTAQTADAFMAELRKLERSAVTSDLNELGVNISVDAGFDATKRISATIGTDPINFDPKNPSASFEISEQKREGDSISEIDRLVSAIYSSAFATKIAKTDVNLVLGFLDIQGAIEYVSSLPTLQDIVKTQADFNDLLSSYVYKFTFAPDPINTLKPVLTVKAGTTREQLKKQILDAHIKFTQVNQQVQIVDNEISSKHNLGIITHFDQLVGDKAGVQKLSQAQIDEIANTVFGNETFLEATKAAQQGEFWNLNISTNALEEKAPTASQIEAAKAMFAIQEISKTETTQRKFSAADLGIEHTTPYTEFAALLDKWEATQQDTMKHAIDASVASLAIAQRMIDSQSYISAVDGFTNVEQGLHVTASMSKDDFKALLAKLQFTSTMGKRIQYAAEGDDFQAAISRDLDYNFTIDKDDATKFVFLFRAGKEGSGPAQVAISDAEVTEITKTLLANQKVQAQLKTGEAKIAISFLDAYDADFIKAEETSDAADAVVRKYMYVSGDAFNKPQDYAEPTITLKQGATEADIKTALTGLQFFRPDETYFFTKVWTQLRNAQGQVDALSGERFDYRISTASTSAVNAGKITDAAATEMAKVLAARPQLKELVAKQAETHLLVWATDTQGFAADKTYGRKTWAEEDARWLWDELHIDPVTHRPIQINGDTGKRLLDTENPSSIYNEGRFVEQTIDDLYTIELGSVPTAPDPVTGRFPSVKGFSSFETFLAEISSHGNATVDKILEQHRLSRYRQTAEITLVKGAALDEASIKGLLLAATFASPKI